MLSVEGKGSESKECLPLKLKMRTRFWLYSDKKRKKIRKVNKIQLPHNKLRMKP